jgi:tetratricopeptide (TPR) repeat protein
MKKALLIITLLLSIESSYACLNEYRTLLTGEVVHREAASGKVWNREIDTVELTSKSKELLLAYKRSDSIEYYSDYAAALTYLGQYQKAKKIYLEIEQRTPNLYTTASNLGTIYELIGKPDSALVWIKKSIRLNPNSHKGSEWIHLKILEYKLSKSVNTTHSILGLDFGNAGKPTNPHNYDLQELEEHLWHQLRERTGFVKPQNTIVGNLYFDLGNILAQTRDVQAALESYEAAKEYGFESELMNDRISEFESLAKKAEWTEATTGFVKRNPFLALSIVFTVFVLCIILIIRIVKRIRKRRKAKG